MYGADDPVVLANDLPAPTGLYVAGDDLYVGDRDLGQIRLVARNGEALSEPEIVADGLDAPEGFVVAENGIVVVEAAAARIVHLDGDRNRRVLAEMPAGSPGAPGLPPSQIFNGIAMDDDGNLFITGESARVLYRIKAPW